MTSQISREPIVPHRVRHIRSGTFAFLPHRFLRDGFLASLSPAERSLYLFLVLAADCHGLSFYGHERICSTLQLTADQYLQARHGLVARDLLAFDGRRFQVLSLPPQPVLPTCTPQQPSTAKSRDRDPATIRQIIEAFLSAK
jgi:hypothetical protein